MSSLSLITSSLVLFIILNYTQAQTTCVPNYCGTNGECQVRNGRAVCDCKVGFVGTTCQLTDPCISRPCAGRGACFPVLQTVNLVERATFYCQCYAGYSGTTCQTIGAGPCATNPCLNNATCAVAANGLDYSCTCVGPYSGPRCGTFVNYCDGNRCANGGTCIVNNILQAYSCRCVNGFTGKFCETEINECLTTVNGVTRPVCQNNATCFDLIDAYLCSCNGPFTGTNCETAVDPCSGNPCGANASCKPNGTSFTCTCNEGFFGFPCKANVCGPTSCKKRDSTCVSVEVIGNAIIGNGCTCNNNVQTAFVCVCNAPLPFVSSEC